MMQIKSVTRDPRPDSGRSHIALYRWTEAGSIGASIAFELEQLGYEVSSLDPDQAVPESAQIVFTYAPYGRWMHIPRQIQALPPESQPLLIHWNTEGLPTANIPLPIQNRFSRLRSQLDEFIVRGRGRPLPARLDRLLEARMLRYRYLGDYLQAHESGIPFLLVDISSIYRDRLAQLGVPAINVPYGSSSQWYEDLNLYRDIDVLWIGSHGSGHRSKNLARLHRELASRGIHLRLVDGRSEPFVHGDARTELLNRTKVVLNLLRTPYDDNTLRMFIAMPNRAMVISEPIMAHNRLLQSDVHFKAAPLAQLPETIEYYLANETRRTAFVERAFQLTTKTATMQAMLGEIMAEAERRFGERLQRRA